MLFFFNSKAFLLSTICKFIEFEFTITSNKTTLTEDLITNAFYVIGDWVMADQKILKSKDLLKKIFRVLEIGMGRVHSKDNQNSSGSGSASGGSNSGNNGGSSGNVSTNSSNNANANSGTQNNANINVHSSINSQSPNISQSSINTPTVQANSSANNASNSSTSITASGSSGNLSNITVIHQDRNLFNATHRIRVTYLDNSIITILGISRICLSYYYESNRYIPRTFRSCSIEFCSNRRRYFIHFTSKT